MDNAMPIEKPQSIGKKIAAWATIVSLVVGAIFWLVRLETAPKLADAQAQSMCKDMVSAIKQDVQADMKVADGLNNEQHTLLRTSITTTQKDLARLDERIQSVQATIQDMRSEQRADRKDTQDLLRRLLRQR